MRRWLTRAVQKNRSIGVTAPVVGGGLSGGSGVGSNTASGFSEAGFATMVESWLSECFPTPELGGFICVLDNLELLERSQVARGLLESMRDEVLGLPGLRWVLCGSRGIVRSVASSSRLEGRLADPMEVGPLSHEYVGEVVQKRIEHYRVVDGAVAPVRREAFQFMYEVMGRNLRNALKYCDDFSYDVWSTDPGELQKGRQSNFELLEAWLAQKADQHLADTRIGDAAWTVFDQLVRLGGSCSPSHHEAFGYVTPMAMRPQIKALEDVNLVSSSVDEVDRRRKTINVTPRGRLVDFARNGYQPRARS